MSLHPFMERMFFVFVAGELLSNALGILCGMVQQDCCEWVQTR